VWSVIRKGCSFKAKKLGSWEAAKIENREQKTEDRRQKTEDRRQKTEDRRQKTEDRRQKTLSWRLIRLGIPAS